MVLLHSRWNVGVCMYSYVRIEGVGSGEIVGQVSYLYVSVRLFPHLTRVESGQAATDAILEAGQNLVI